MLAFRTFKKAIFFGGFIYATIFIGALILPAIILGILSLAGNYGPPTLSVSAKNPPFYAGTQNNPLNSGEITWDVAPITYNDYPLSAADVEFAFGYVLSHPNGWVDAGLEFKLVEASTQPPDILFVLLPGEMLEKICNSSYAGGCAASDSVHGYIRVFPLELKMPNKARMHNTTGARCSILLGQYQTDPFVLALIVNHEVGHCMGLGHSSNRADVMFPASNFSGLPSPAEIELIRQKVKK